MNYQTELEKTIFSLQEQKKVPRLLLHSCCAPCSSYVLEYLNSIFEITVFYYNPNITPQEEYDKRVDEVVRLTGSMPFNHPVCFKEGNYEPDRFFAMAKGLENEPEGGRRCDMCYRLRLEESAKLAKEGNFDFFTTTLTISPLKKADKLNEIGRELSAIYGVPYLFSDFKKKDGFKRSIELSRQYGLYRQDYCGCVFSRRHESNHVVN